MANESILNTTSGLQFTADPVRIDANRQAYRLLTVDRGPTDIPVGAPFAIDASGKGIDVPVGGLEAHQREIALRVSLDGAFSTNPQQGIYETGGAIFNANLPSGAFTGLKANGIRVGLPPTDEFFDSVDLASGNLFLPGQFLVLKIETAGAAIPRNGFVKFGLASGGVNGTSGLEDLGATQKFFGVVERNEGSQILWFTYFSTAQGNHF